MRRPRTQRPVAASRVAIRECPSFVSAVIVPPTGPSPPAIGFKGDERQRTGNARRSPPGSAAVTAHTRITRTAFVARSSGLPLPGGAAKHSASQFCAAAPRSEERPPLAFLATEDKECAHAPPRVICAPALSLSQRGYNRVRHPAIKDSEELGSDRFTTGVHNPLQPGGAMTATRPWRLGGVTLLAMSGLVLSARSQRGGGAVPLDGSWRWGETRLS